MLVLKSLKRKICLSNIAVKRTALPRNCKRIDYHARKPFKQIVKDCKNEEHECLDNEDVVSKNRDKLIVINILGSAPITVINDMFRCSFAKTVITSSTRGSKKESQFNSDGNLIPY